MFEEHEARLYDEVIDAGYHDQKSYLSELFKILVKNSSILELGCGTGKMTIPLIKKGFFVDALDKSSFMISQLKYKLRKIKVYESDIKDFAPRKSYDYIISCNGPFSIKGDEIESYILEEEELIEVINKLSSRAKIGLLINKGIEKNGLHLKLKNNRRFAHFETREGDYMIMNHLLFKKNKLEIFRTHIKKRYPFNKIFRNAKYIKDYDNFKLIKL